MATQIPLRSVRIPALQRQCLFLRYQRLNRPFAAAASRTFSSTPSHARSKTSPFMQDKAQTRAAAQSQSGPAPRVNMEKMQRREGRMVEDIGILQGTMVRAPISKLPKVTRKAFWGYFWSLLKSKGMALYSRSVHRRAVQKTRLSRFLPIDAFGNKALKERAQNMYKDLYTSFAEGNTKAIEEICLPPLADQFQKRITARSNLEVTWKLHEWKSVKVMSHRSAPLGEDQPGSVYRQAVIRLVSLQSATRKRIEDAAKSAAGKASLEISRKKPAWLPEEAREKLKQTPKMEKIEKSTETTVSKEFVGNGEPKEVVEYLVLQQRTVSGVNEGWKIQGFTEESTPKKIESDGEYWSKQLSVQAAQTGA